MGHGSTLLVLLFAAGCGSTPPPKPPPVVGNAAVSDATRWNAIAELAKATHEGPPSETLERASETGDVALLVQWMRESGTIRARHGVIDYRLFELARKAIESATAADWEPLAAGGTLGLHMVVDGTSFLDVELGLDLCDEAARKLRTLGEPANGLERPLTTDLARIVAAEAMHAREMIETYDTPEGRKALEDSFGGDPGFETMRAFWPAALAGARRGEAAATTLQRMREAAATMPAKSQELLRMILRQTERIANQLETLERLGP